MKMFYGVDVEGGWDCGVVVVAFAMGLWFRELYLATTVALEGMTSVVVVV